MGHWDIQTSPRVALRPVTLLIVTLLIRREPPRYPSWSLSGRSLLRCLAAWPRCVSVIAGTWCWAWLRG
jgi:hypothetical protein